MNQQSIYRGYRFPPDVIAYAVWLYHRFSLSLRDIEDLLAERGVLVSYETVRQWAAKREVMRSVPHCRERYANNRAEVSHEHTRTQERQMRGFRRVGSTQRFLAVHGQCHNLFRVGRHLLSAKNNRLLRDQSYPTWSEVTCA